MQSVSESQSTMRVLMLDQSVLMGHVDTEATPNAVLLEPLVLRDKLHDPVEILIDLKASRPLVIE